MPRILRKGTVWTMFSNWMFSLWDSYYFERVKGSWGLARRLRKRGDFGEKEKEGHGILMKMLWMPVYTYRL